MGSNYDNAAWFYDRLSKMVYGQHIINAHRFLIIHIPAGSRILIVGGGTGYVLDEITKVLPSGLIITYVEISAKMMALARKRNTGSNHVLFINSSIDEVELMQYDVLFTPFLFDNFSQPQFEQIFIQLHNTMVNGGVWLNADFQLTGKWWQKWLLKAMFIFFKVLGCVKVSQLPAIKTEFNKFQYDPVAYQTFFNEFIWSAVYKHRLMDR